MLGKTASVFDRIICEQNVVFLNVKRNDVYSNHYVLKSSNELNIPKIYIRL